MFVQSKNSLETATCYFIIYENENCFLFGDNCHCSGRFSWRVLVPWVGSIVSFTFVILFFGNSLQRKCFFIV